MKYIVHQDFVEDKIFSDFEDVCQYIGNLDFHSCYDEALDDTYEAAQICGYEYSPAEALKIVDPVAYRCGYNDWLNGEIYDNGLAYRLDCMRNGDSINFYDLEISCEEEEEED